jgi:hypothetical protein
MYSKDELTDKIKTRLKNLLDACFKKAAEEATEEGKKATCAEDIPRIYGLLPTDISDPPDKSTSELTYSDRRYIVRLFDNAVADACKEFREQTRKKYSKEFKKDGLPFPTGWMIDDKKLKQMIESHPMFIQILNYLCGHQMSHERSQEKSGIGKHKMISEQRIKLNNGKYSDEITLKKVERDYVLLDIDPVHAAKTLGVSPILIKKYLQQFCKIGVLKKLGQRGHVVYAWGYFHPWKNKDGIKSYTPMSFLTEKMKDDLKAFYPLPR